MKRLAAVILCVLLLTFGMAAMSIENPGAAETGYEYTLNEDGSAEITRYTGGEQRPAIPGQLDGHPVSQIGAFAFSSGSLQYAVIPEGVRSIGDYAFSGCDALTGVALPASVTAISQGAFAYCGSLESIKVPALVTHIGINAFLACGKLTLEVEEASLAHLYAVENHVPFILAPMDTGGTFIVVTAVPLLETSPGFIYEPLAASTPAPEVFADDIAPPKPWPVESTVLYALQAVNKGDQRAMAWCGPGKGYREAGAFKTNKLLKVKGILTQGDYVLVDMDYAGVGRRRVYFNQRAFKDTGHVPQRDLTGYDAFTVRDAMPLYGPGSGFDDFDGETLPGGVQISVFFEENGWVYAQFNSSEGLARGWIEEGSVRPAGM